MPRVPSALLISCLALLGPSSAGATSAIDERLAEAGVSGIGAAEPGLAASPSAAEPVYGEILAEPGGLAGALRALPEGSRPPRVFPGGLGSGIAASATTVGRSLEAPLPDSGDLWLAPVDLAPELGLPAPVDLEPR